MANQTHQVTTLPDGAKIHHGPYPELTWHAVIVGWVLGALIAVSIGYAALILGFSIEGSELAAILGWGILRGIMGRTSIVENNINQTIASAVNGASSGMMFSIPALFILNRQFSDKYAGIIEFNKVLMVLACATGAVVGLAFVIPLRKQMIDFDRLAYPGGIAVATILKSPGAGTQKAMLLIGGAVVSGIFYICMIAFVGDHPAGYFGEALRLPPFLNLTFFLSLMTVGVGFLSGKGGYWFGAGGFICYWILAPLLGAYGAEPVQAMVHPEGLQAVVDGTVKEADAIHALWNQVPTALRLQLFRPSGIGMLIGAAIGGIIAAFPLMLSAFKSMRDAAREGGSADADEMPLRNLIIGVFGGAAILILVTWSSVESISFTTAATMAILGTIWVWIAGVIVSECVGRTNWSPLSGMTLIAVTILIVIASGSGMDDTSVIVASMFLGGAMCVGISQASDMMLDLKSGYLVGAQPKMQQYGQLIGTWLGPIVVIGVILLLHENQGLGSDKLPAPQGQALASMIQGVIGDNVPDYRYAAGGGLGLLLALSGLGGIGVQVGLGFYMPFDVVLTYTIGCTLRVIFNKYADRKFVEGSCVPIAAGLIVGEALVGVGNAIYQILLK